MNNSRGTNHEPWWTSCPNLILSEKQPPEKACWQTVGKVQFKPLQSFSRPVIPRIDCGWWSRILWTTMSKAAQRSGKTTCFKVSCVAGSHPSCDLYVWSNTACSVSSDRNWRLLTGHRFSKPNQGQPSLGGCLQGLPLTQQGSSPLRAMNVLCAWWQGGVHWDNQRLVKLA